ncbi:MAG: hypothetical protein B0D92_07630 [Spirochaeta sp. LUC14_002_19_P3]|nr:MAG: hypothetical protein B0D92_07630 [Spirochaeta sp. LUC14_002_19_P3]
MPLLSYPQSEENPMVLKTIPFDEFYSVYKERKSNGKGIILDIRTPREYDRGHVPAAKNIDYYAADFNQQLSKLDKDNAYFIYCNSGNRSGNSLKLFKELGFKEVYDLRGGWMWNKKGLLSLQ